MTLVRPGDVIFSYANQSIGAIGVASSSAYDAPQPDELGNVWENDGRHIDGRQSHSDPSRSDMALWLLGRAAWARKNTMVKFARRSHG